MVKSSAVPPNALEAAAPPPTSAPAVGVSSRAAGAQPRHSSPHACLQQRLVVSSQQHMLALSAPEEAASEAAGASVASLPDAVVQAELLGRLLSAKDLAAGGYLLQVGFWRARKGTSPCESCLSEMSLDGGLITHTAPHRSCVRQSPAERPCQRPAVGSPGSSPLGPAACRPARGLSRPARVVDRPQLATAPGRAGGGCILSGPSLQPGARCGWSALHCKPQCHGATGSSLISSRSISAAAGAAGWRTEAAPCSNQLLLLASNRPCLQRMRQRTSC